MRCSTPGDVTAASGAADQRCTSDADPLLDFDETPAFHPADPDLLPDYDFDQTLGA